jgi:hypothetical protein
MLTGTSQAGAPSQLERLDADGVLSRGAPMRRNAHLIASPRIR